jgi:membrane protein required for colicin V production
MNPFDMAIIVILGYSIIRGIFRGLIKEVSSIVGLAAGFYVAYSYHGRVSPLFAGWITEPAYLKITTFIFLFCSVFFAIALMGILIRYIIKLVLLGVVDRIFGGVFGALKAVLIVSFAYILLITFLPAGGVSVVGASKLAPPINALAGGIVRVVPKDVRDSYLQKIAELKKDWNQKT